MLFALFALVATSAMSGCDQSGPATARMHEAAALTDQEGAVCGMLVRAQSAPRSQIVHRDGSRFFFCSLGDMLVHLGAPSPHGRAEAIFVEAMLPEEDPLQSHTGDHPWVPAEDATYVVGVARQGIMGEPVLAYATRGEAEAAMLEHGGAQLLDLPGLREWWTAEQAAH